MNQSLRDAGTPATLDEAIRNALCIGPLNEVPERAYHVLRDFLAQKFGVTYLELSHDPAAFAAVEKLFEQLTARPAKISGIEKG